VWKRAGYHRIRFDSVKAAALPSRRGDDLADHGASEFLLAGNVPVADRERIASIRSTQGNTSAFHSEMEP